MSFMAGVFEPDLLPHSMKEVLDWIAIIISGSVVLALFGFFLGGVIMCVVKCYQSFGPQPIVAAGGVIFCVAAVLWAFERLENL